MSQRRAGAAISICSAERYLHVHLRIEQRCMLCTGVPRVLRAELHAMHVLRPLDCERGSRVTLTPKCCPGSFQGSRFRIPGPHLGVAVTIPLHGPSYFQRRAPKRNAAPRCCPALQAAVRAEGAPCPTRSPRCEPGAAHLRLTCPAARANTQHTKAAPH